MLINDLPNELTSVILDHVLSNLGYILILKSLCKQWRSLSIRLYNLKTNEYDQKYSRNVYGKLRCKLLNEFLSTNKIEYPIKFITSTENVLYWSNKIVKNVIRINNDELTNLCFSKSMAINNYLPKHLKYAIANQNYKFIDKVMTTRVDYQKHGYSYDCLGETKCDFCRCYVYSAETGNIQMLQWYYDKCKGIDLDIIDILIKHDRTAALKYYMEKMLNSKYEITLKKIDV